MTLFLYEGASPGNTHAARRRGNESENRNRPRTHRLRPRGSLVLPAGGRVLRGCTGPTPGPSRPGDPRRGSWGWGGGGGVEEGRAGRGPAHALPTPPPRPATIIADDSGRSSTSKRRRRQLIWMGPEVSSWPVATSLYLLLSLWQRGGYFQTLPALYGHVTPSFNS